MLLISSRGLDLHHRIRGALIMSFSKRVVHETCKRVLNDLHQSLPLLPYLCTLPYRVIL